MTKLVRLWKRPCKNGQEFKYVLIWYDEQGKEHWQALKHADARRAEKQRAQKERELRMGLVETKSMKLTELLDDYLRRTRTQIEESTAISAAYRMKDFIAAVGNVYADAITYRHVEKFQQYCIDKGLSPASANTHIKMVKRIFSLAVKRGQLEKNPFDGIPLLKVPQGIVRLITDQELLRILNAAQELIWKARILLGKTTGLRRGEILNLTINDIDFSLGKIIVQPKSDTKHTWRWVVKDKERREVPLIEEVAQLLIELQETVPEGQPHLLLTPERYRYMMQLKASDKLIDRVAKCPDSNFRRNWKVICKHAGIDDVTFHDLRSTCITEWFEQGMMPHEIQRLAGHSSIETTMKYYVGIRETMIGRAREASSAALNGDSIANSLQQGKNHQNSNNDDIAIAMQTLIRAGVINIGARGLEPPTS